ncbi:MAG: toxin-antitoxin system HicB family antitoxin [Proteobacteria bacterium]|nr:toxin-antitoxin system HicB family antitoxin [Pseudomonadota bacterium]NDG27261.1 toxin-antitoxin system HicB family antitoxin [Pseudomonadota bacterium]
MQKPSGKFVLRISPKLHTCLQKWANGKKVSLNQYCLERLLAGVGAEHPSFQSTLIDALFQATQIHGNDLEGIILFGSWARGEQREGSDIDILVVLKQGLSIKRELYRKWDESSGLLVEPSIVALPDLRQAFTGLWAEVSIDGIILFERNYKIRHYLFKVRQAIANGLLRRERSHGQNYWVHETKVA